MKKVVPVLLLVAVMLLLWAAISWVLNNYNVAMPLLSFATGCAVTALALKPEYRAKTKRQAGKAKDYIVRSFRNEKAV